MELSKNKPCACGSGKKFKICCMGKDIVKIKKFNFNQPSINRSSQSNRTHNLIHEFTFEPIFQDEMAMPHHPIPKGLRSFCIYRLEQIIRELENSNPNDRLLKAYYGELYWLFYKNMNLIENKINEIKSVSTIEVFMEFESEGLTDIEQQIVLDRTVSSSLLDYAYGTLDFGAFKIVASFCKQILLQGLSDDRNVGLVQLKIDTGDELVGWEFVESKRKSSRIHYEFVSMDALDNEYKKLKVSLSGFSDASLKTIATALTQEDALKKSKDLISYVGLVMNYFGVLEQELRNIVYKHNNKLTKKRMMWRDLAQYFKENTFPILTKFMPEVGKELEDFNEMRNHSAHGEFITYEEFTKLKAFIFKNRAFEYMSWELNGEIPKRKQMGVIESHVTYDEGELQVDMDSFNKSIDEIKNIDVIEPTMHPGMKDTLESIKKGEAVLTADYDGGKILFQKTINGLYKATKLNSLNREIGRKILKENELVMMFEKGSYIGPN
ncbi:SEC-C domain-containing protein [Neobacillus niacini]|uniref:SEC-C domain-containing protein n=1 Tax=Neobacillus niacini TaxID=86668 RepID=UPI002FFE788D